MIFNRNIKKISTAADGLYKKSNEISMSQLNSGLTLNQTHLLTYAIFNTQQNGVSEFKKVDFENMMKKSSNSYELRKDALFLMDLKFAIGIDRKTEFDFLNIFQRFRYKDGVITVKWSEDMIPHIMNLQDKYIVADLNITSNFSSSHSWVLYEYLKANYGRWSIELTKENLMNLFGVSHVKTYQNKTYSLKQKVLNVAVEEINKYTEYQVSYKDIKKGRSIVGFLIEWSVGEIVKGATSKQKREAERKFNHLIDLISEVFLKEDLPFEKLQRLKELQEKAGDIYDGIKDENATYEDAVRLMPQFEVVLFDIMLMVKNKNKYTLPGNLFDKYWDDDEEDSE